MRLISSSAPPTASRSGQMTSGEAAKTNGNQAKTAQQVHDERTANGGALNARQKKASQQRAKQKQQTDLQRKAQRQDHQTRGRLNESLTRSKL